MLSLKIVDLLEKQRTHASSLKQLSPIGKFVSQLNLHIKQCEFETALSTEYERFGLLIRNNIPILFKKNRPWELRPLKFIRDCVSGPGQVA